MIQHSRRDFLKTSLAATALTGIASAAGQGIISMKLIGEGSLNREDRQKGMRYAFQTAKVDSVPWATKSPQEVDEAIDNLALALVFV